MNRTSNATPLKTVNGTSTLVRARFGPGMLLHHDDLEQLNTYTRDLSRLLFRSFFGCGVVCGLVVKEPETDSCGNLSITVSKGLALDCAGDPVYVPKEQSVVIDQHCEAPMPSQLWVILCRKSTCCSPRTPVCASDEEESSSVCTRERDGFEIRVVSELPKCVCGCVTKGKYESKHTSECWCVDPEHPCYRAHYAGECDCDGGDDCGCCCECVLLARLDQENGGWTADHSVRRFVRPVLMRDPQVAAEQASAAQRRKAVVYKEEQQRLAREREDALARQREKEREQDLAKERERQQRELTKQQAGLPKRRDQATKPAKPARPPKP